MRTTIVERCVLAQTFTEIDPTSDFIGYEGNKRIQFDISLGAYKKGIDPWCDTLRALLTDTTIPEQFRYTDLLFFATDPSGKYSTRSVYAKNCLLTELSSSRIVFEGTCVTGPFVNLIAQAKIDQSLREENDTQQS